MTSPICLFEIQTYVIVLAISLSLPPTVLASIARDVAPSVVEHRGLDSGHCDAEAIWHKRRDGLDPVFTDN
jgi:hypothetical protein